MVHKMKKILISTESYFPGIKGGGPVQSIGNLIKLTKQDVDYTIITANHDFGEEKKYDGIVSDDFNLFEGTEVFYSSDTLKNKNVWNLIQSDRYDIFYLNDLFSSDTRIFLKNYLKSQSTKPLIIMPRGQLNQGAISIKAYKKIPYLTLFQFIMKNKNVYYVGTSDEEVAAINKYLPGSRVFQVSNIPSIEKKVTYSSQESPDLRLVFISRITTKKNLDYALKVLKDVQVPVTFDIYGIIEDEAYWEMCQSIIEKMPNHIQVAYKGICDSKDVVATLSHYDLFFFPSKSENYGHVISEALQASIPVLIGDTTPWQQLETKGWGWEYPLESPEKFVATIEDYSQRSLSERNKIKEYIFESFDVAERAKSTAKQYKDLFDAVMEA